MAMRDTQGKHERQPVLISVSDAASLLSLSPRTVKALIAAGTLPSRKIGGRRLVPYRALMAFSEQDQPVTTRRVVQKSNSPTNTQVTAMSCAARD